ncbi:MAG: DUF6268 family outer membrane beta-barrel protein [Phycisphaera sp.]|nr:MAG: DUF6268 family outer membrane beta-barrel protein [Phycisphaera sp.]
MRIAIAVCFIFAAPVAMAQSEEAPPEQPAQASAAPEAGPEDAQPQQPSRPRFLYKVGASIDAQSVPHIGGGGDATTVSTRTDFSITWLASQRTQMILDVSNEFAHYDFDGAFGLDPVDGAPFSSFTRQNFDLLVAHAIDRRWSVLAVGGVGVARERTADVGDSIVWRAGVGATYRVAPTVTLGVTVFAQSQLENDTEIFPIPQVDAEFQLAEQWTLKLATIGGAVLSYQATEELAFNLKAGYDERQFRLDDTDFAPDGVFQDKAIDLMLGVNWTPAPGVEVTAGVGSQLWRRFKVKDSDGNRLSRVETDPTLMLHAGLSYSF